MDFFYIFIAIIVLYLYSKLSIKWTNTKVCLVGKTAIITGANSGLGFKTAMDLAMRGCRVILADVEDCTASRDKIISETQNANIEMRRVDLQSLKSTREFAQDILKTEKQLHILVCNAGIGARNLVYTEDGLQRTMQVNYFSHFLLVHLLLGLMEKSAPARVIFTSSIGAYFSNLREDYLNPPTGFKETKNPFCFSFYGRSKLAMVCACISFTEKFQNRGVTFNCLHPGGVKTNIYATGWKMEKYMLLLVLWLAVKLFGRSEEEGIQTLIHLSCARELKNVSGKFFMDCSEYRMPVPKVTNNKMRLEKIWNKSVELVKLQPHELLC